MPLHIFNIRIKKGKFAFKIVGINQTSISHLLSPNARNFIDRKASYHQYLAKPRRKGSGFDGYDRYGHRRRTDDQNELLLSSFKSLKALDQ
jgi:hypothetical protein